MNALKVTLIQSYLFWENIDKNLHNLALKLATIKEKTDLILLPEMFSTGFTMDPESFAEEMDGKTMQWMHEKANRYNAVVAGTIVIKENGKFFNRLIWMKPDGNYHQYDKKHLFAMAKEDEKYTPGTEKLMVELNGWKIMPVICYDLRFPVWLRNEKPYYDLLVVLANWPEKRAQHWNTLIAARAIENQAYIIALNRVGHDGNQHYYCGDTTCLDPKGDVVYYKRDEEDIYTFTIYKNEIKNTREAMPFLNDADGFKITQQ